MIWDDYCQNCAAGLLRLVHSQALAQLCEDKVLEFRFRRALSMLEEASIRTMEGKIALMQNQGHTVDPRDVLPGGPLAEIVMTEEGSSLFRDLNQTELRVQRQEQQFGLTPRAAAMVDIASSGKISEDFEEQLCG